MRKNRLRAAVFAATASLAFLTGNAADGWIAGGPGGGSAFAADAAKDSVGLGAGAPGLGSVSSSPSGQGTAAPLPSVGLGDVVPSGEVRSPGVNGSFPSLGNGAVDINADRGNSNEPGSNGGTDADPSKTETVGPNDDEGLNAAATTMAASAATTPAVEGGSVDGAPKVQIPVISGNGSLAEQIAIDAPAFHGIEPRIALNYNSGRKSRLGGLYQGWLGYGWGLDGFDVIERASPGYGIPAYDAADVYLLNGQELVGCVSGMVSASCAASGTHATENENYKRIIFNTAANTWTVTDRDGTVSLFRSVMSVAGSNPASGTADYDLQRNGRWLLSSVTDTNGNTVAYNYNCPDIPVCIPSSVTYGHMAVNFYYDPRPDIHVMGNGYGLSYTKHRLKTITTSVSGQFRKVYKFSYDQAPLSNASRLVRVELYGQDVVFDCCNNPVGGLRKTIRSMVYDNLSMSYIGRNNQFFANSQWQNLSLSYFLLQQTGDLNFDGRDELYGAVVDWESQYRTLKWAVTEFSDNGTVQKVNKGNFPNNSGVDWHIESIHSNIKFLSGRFIESKLTKDIPFTYKYSEYVSSDAGNGDYFYFRIKGVTSTNANLGVSSQACPGSYASICSALPSTYNASDEWFLSLDSDGDGVDTLYNFSNGMLGVADFFGNGRQGALSGGQLLSYRYLNGGWQTQSTGVSCGSRMCILGDLNGDGATDIVRLSTSGNSYKIDVWLSAGRAYVNVVANLPFNGIPILRDMDNDGKMELLVTANATNTEPFRQLRIHSLWTGASGNSLQPYATTINGSNLSGDFNGDGLPDFVTSATATLISQAGSGNPNLLRSITLETGGTVSVDYTPSTRFSNGYLPQVLHPVTKVTVNDGRGTVASTDYAYSGGLYDPKARKFLGYRTITMTKPAANGEASRPVTEITYRQDLASYGLPQTTVFRNGTNTASKTVSETYSVNATTKPYRALNTATETTLNEGGASVVLRKERTFDAYGNVTYIRDFGRKDLAGDEVWTSVIYVNNTSAYIVSLPRWTWVKSGGFDAATAVFERQEGLYYDGATASTTVPTRGNLTMRRYYKSAGATETSYTETFTYDSYGNKLSHVNGAGNRTEWDYDTTHRLYVVKERAPKYFAASGLGSGPINMV